MYLTFIYAQGIIYKGWSIILWGMKLGSVLSFIMSDKQLDSTEQLQLLNTSTFILVITDVWNTDICCSYTFHVDFKAFFVKLFFTWNGLYFFLKKAWITMSNWTLLKYAKPIEKCRKWHRRDMGEYSLPFYQTLIFCLVSNLSFNKKM